MASSNDDSATKRSGRQSQRPQDGSASKAKRKPRDRPQTQVKENLAPSAAESTPPSTPAKSAKSTSSNPPATDGQPSRTPKIKKGKPSGRESAPPAGTQSTPPVTVTPAKPVQIYAGPTFHASPAPSSLPIPKMFSKSVPHVNDKDASLRSMLQSSEVSGDESSEPEGSPSARSPMQSQARGAREDSPLDIFFRADKEEKARRQASASQSSLVTPPSHRRAQSNSPGPDSAGRSMFSLEMENPPRTPSSRLEDSPSMPDRSHDRRPTDAQAKTEALKNLLRFQGAPSPRPTTAPRPALTSSRSSSTPPTAPPPFERSASDHHLHSDRSSNQAHPSPSWHQQQHRPHTRQSSQLRQQLDQVANEHYSSPSASPQPWPMNNPRVPQHQAHAYYPPPPPHPTAMPSGAHRASPGPPTFGPQDAIRASMGAQASTSASAPGSSQGGATSTEAMEEQLRRILKLDSISGSGVHT